MKFVVIADVHFETYDNFGSSDLGLGSSRVEICHKALTYVLNYCLQRQIKLMVVVGDLFHKKAGTKSEVIHHLKLILDEFKKNGIRVILISGNHDFIDRDCTRSLMDILSDGKDIKAIDKISFEQIDENCYFFYLPDIEPKVELLNQLSTWSSELPPSSRKYLFAHLGIGGAMYNSSKVSDSPIKVSDLHRDSYNFVFLGDYHRRQCLDNWKVWYVGALLQSNFGEEGNPQGFVEIDSTFESVVWVDLPKQEFPEFLTLRVGEPVPSGFHGYTRVVSSQPVEKNLLEAYLEQLKGISNAVFVEVPTKVQNSAVRLDFSKTTGTLEDQIELYIEHKAPPNLDKERLKSLAHSFK